ncbi:protein tyrosine phosphatase [Pholiota conissans]|uniref:Very-long-chain (3R)-3-hydroxyacyl-CoA dehydratase n=1 Tax=Pholiota conissans TaxID=109636 RepID=A0A9P5ZBJ9_9AGAR|nr:protein tyrosine phosphatase [Pholiota conissans]
MSGTVKKPKQLPSTPTSKAMPKAIKAYLIFYNVASALGWGYILLLTLTHIFNLDGNSDVSAAHTKTATSVISRVLSSFSSPLKILKASSVESQLPAYLQPLYRRTETTFTRVGVKTAFVQSFATLEVVHVLLKWVRSPLQTTAMQVASRLFLVWGIAEQFPEVRSNPLYTSMVLAWSVTEIIRYSFYAFNLVGRNPHALLWLRYTSFYILYPLGAGSEAFLIYATLPSSPLIPGWQAWFQGTWKPTDYARGILFLIWWPGLYVMYTYMISQRRKVIGKPGGKTLKTN